MCCSDNIFKVSQKSGFYSFDPVVKIYDNNGKLFYLKENKKGKLYFNLPTGVYKTFNTLSKQQPRKYKETKLPKANNPKQLPSRFKIVYCRNPNKCSVDNNKHIIYFDHSFKNVPLPVKDYIKFHELGHYFYSGEGNKSEILCDLFAKNCMLKCGYNPSQIRWAQSGTLSNHKTSKQRKQKVNDKLKNSFV
jgi:hypothetical protein